MAVELKASKVDFTLLLELEAEEVEMLADRWELPNEADQFIEAFDAEREVKPLTFTMNGPY